MRNLMANVGLLNRFVSLQNIRPYSAPGGRANLVETAAKTSFKNIEKLFHSARFNVHQRLHLVCSTWGVV
jgi:hypothetical protein